MRWILVGLFLGLVGCGGGSTLPPTHPVTGKAFDAKGKAFSGGMVQFTSAADSTLTVTGVIETYGTYALKTAQARNLASGAPVGDYKVTILPPISSDQTGSAPSELPGQARIKEGANRFDLRVGKEPKPAS